MPMPHTAGRRQSHRQSHPLIDTAPHAHPSPTPNVRATRAYAHSDRYRNAYLPWKKIRLSCLDRSNVHTPLSYTHVALARPGLPPYFHPSLTVYLAARGQVCRVGSGLFCYSHPIDHAGAGHPLAEGEAEARGSGLEGCVRDRGSADPSALGRSDASRGSRTSPFRASQAITISRGGGIEESTRDSALCDPTRGRGLAEARPALSTCTRPGSPAASGSDGR